MPLTRTVRPPLTLPDVVPVTNSPDSRDFFQGHPRSEALGGVAADDGVAVAVFHGHDGDGHKLTYLNFELTLVAFEFGQWNIGFGLEAGIDHDEVVFDANDFSGDDFTDAGFRAFL
jgi:hypothetical protein